MFGECPFPGLDSHLSGDSGSGGGVRYTESGGNGRGEYRYVAEGGVGKDAFSASKSVPSVSSLPKVSVWYDGITGPTLVWVG